VDTWRLPGVGPHPEATIRCPLIEWLSSLTACVLPGLDEGKKAVRIMATRAFIVPKKKLSFAAMAALLLCALARPQRCAAEEHAAPAPQAVEETPTMFPHSQTARWWVSGQANTIFQAHPDFHAAYSGTNSMRPQGENKTSYVETLYLGYQLGHGAEVFLDMESAGGHGLSEALGLAGFTNLDVVRKSQGRTPYVARVEFHQTLRLSAENVAVERGPLALATSAPARRLELRIGKLSTVDFFDANGVGSDSHLQFMNWTVDANGAYDYAADTHGYTYGFLAEYQSKGWAFRFGEMLMPKVANGSDLDWNLRRARAESYELELRPGLMKKLLKNRKSVVRLLAYENHADMGDYQAAVARFKAGVDLLPTIEHTRRQGTVKYGFGLNVEQELPRDLRAFLRLGWNEGHHESFAYTEVNSTVAAGADMAGKRWHRELDKVGAAVVSNGISAAHQSYLRNGGHGFLLGDGRLRYGRENILEAYYTLHVWRGLYLSADVQRVWNPGYNRDRGPVLVPGTRLHVEF
jgi:high affinity Mn2+ porin